MSRSPLSASNADRTMTLARDVAVQDVLEGVRGFSVRAARPGLHGTEQ